MLQQGLGPVDDDGEHADPGGVGDVHAHFVGVGDEPWEAGDVPEDPEGAKREDSEVPGASLEALRKLTMNLDLGGANNQSGSLEVVGDDPESLGCPAQQQGGVVL